MPQLNPSNELRRDKLAGGLLVAIGVLILGTAFYFLALRPPLLPEDVRYTNVPEVSPRMADWLGIVFHTWGGFMAGFGILIAAVGGYLATLRPRFLRVGAAVALLVASGRFLVSNIELHSDFLPFVVAMAALATIAALRLALHS